VTQEASAPLSSMRPSSADGRSTAHGEPAPRQPGPGRGDLLALAPESAWRRLGESQVVVLSGGRSSEREVSLRSGAAVAAALRDASDGRGPRRVREVQLEPDGWWLLGEERLEPAEALARIPVDAPFFLALHGGEGEDGTLQGLLRMLGRRHTGEGVWTSALCMNKSATKDVLRRAGVRVAPGLELPRGEWRTAREASLARVNELSADGWCVKPNSGGSSVATSLESELEGAAAAIERVLATGDRALVEARVRGVETSCGVLGDGDGDVVALMPIEITPKDGRFFDYEEKYSAQGANEHCPPTSLPADACEAIRVAARRAFRAVGGRSYARIDFLTPRTPTGGFGEPVALEVNTLPGMTERSLLPQEAAHAGLSFRDLCLLLSALACKDQA
jgi:D-alanine-D-alanine ligase